MAEYVKKKSMTIPAGKNHELWQTWVWVYSEEYHKIQNGGQGLV